MGEGAGIVVLEEYEHAKARGAKIYAEVAGYGLSGDAYHITSPSEDGDGGYRAMEAALKRRRRLGRPTIDYINAHGTSTMADGIEARRRGRLLWRCHAKNVSMSSTKSMTGHFSGAAGAIEGDLLDPGHPRPDRSADHQPRQPRRRDRDGSRAA
jgi:3-oxoacyl-[acyl-carrier-protein] synthase II